MKPEPGKEMEGEGEVRANLKDMGRYLAGQLPPGWHFALLIASAGEGGVTLYIANIDRNDVIQLMREFIAVQREERNWRRHRSEMEAQEPQLEIEDEFDGWWANQMKRAPNYSGNAKMQEMCRDAFIAGRSTA
jgi:hypothetical protein